MKFREKKTCTKEGSNQAYPIVGFAVLAFYALFLFILFYLAIVTSLKDYGEFMLGSKIGFPKNPSFKNFTTAFEVFGVRISSTYTAYLFEMLLNSVIYSIGCGFTATAVPCLVAYLVAKYNVWLNKVIYFSVIFAISLPIIGALPSEIQIATALSLKNTIYGLWIMRGSYLGMYFLVFYATFKGLSNEYMEAAQMDGASQMAIMFKIVFPLIKTSFFAVFILQFISYWNDYQSPLIYMKSYPTAAVGLFSFMYNPMQTGGALETSQMAGCLILFFPVFILFICFKNIFMGNLTVGGIKG